MIISAMSVTQCAMHIQRTRSTPHTQFTIHRTVDLRLRLRLSDRLTRMRFCSASAANALRAFVSSSCSERQPTSVRRCIHSSRSAAAAAKHRGTAFPRSVGLALCLHRAVGTTIGARLRGIARHSCTPSRAPRASIAYSASLACISPTSAAALIIPPAAADAATGRVRSASSRCARSAASASRRSRAAAARLAAAAACTCNHPAA